MPKKGQFKAGATADSKRQRAYNSSPEQKKRRAERNASRAKMAKAGKVHKNDGLDVDHKSHNTKDQSSKNLRVVSKSKNRAGNQYDPRLKKGKNK